MGVRDVTCKILIVDDSRLARMSVAKALHALLSDWSPIEATSADEAMASARATPPDLALLDFNMPGRDGLTLAAELKALHPAMPVAVVSANLQHEIAAGAARAGATFLSKPVSDGALRRFLVESGVLSGSSAQ